ncbi:hypothetical protein [Paraglaciecola arctica]|uniref:Uncharacterized protein n=1 Tax=Paraglaciecola arctica BSs20135 TaxID=493475 RepID=K6YC48_9ALTE|nr:hypothetical protein [Paraglaciecola arctica]GAC21531.1 hypothetical protein GARC_4589 [Paraglaciecola arctica BSs20135]
MLVKSHGQPILMGNETLLGTSGKEYRSSLNGKTLPQSTNTELGMAFSQSLMQITQIRPSVTSVDDNQITKTEELSEVAAQKKLASAMPLLIQALEKLEVGTTQLAETYNQVTINKGVLTKSDILKLADLEEEIATTRAEIEQIMAPLDSSELQTQQLSALLLPVFEKIDAELETLNEFNKKAAEQLDAIEANNEIVTFDFAFKLSPESFDLIDQEKRLLPFSFEADDLRVINNFLYKNYNDDNVVSLQQGIKNTAEFIESFEKYQNVRKEAYFAQRKLRIDA